MAHPYRDHAASPPDVRDRPPAGRAVVLAPHPDDETFGLGGTLALHVAQGDRVDVIFLTDGGFGDPDGHYSDVDYPALRRREAEAAARVLGVADVSFYGYPDHYPTVRDEDLADATRRLAADLAARAPATVYMPWLGECHPDHRLAALAGVRALATLPATVRGVGYEVWSAMVPDYVIEVTATRETKLAAARCYESQLRYTPYCAVTDGLMTYRALHLRMRPDEPSRYAEAFVEMPRP